MGPTIFTFSKIKYFLNTIIKINKKYERISWHLNLQDQCPNPWAMEPWTLNLELQVMEFRWWCLFLYQMQVY